MAEKEKLPRATHDGVLRIGNIPCANLDDGRRVLSQRGFLAALGRSPHIKGGQKGGDDGPPPFLASKNLQPLLDGPLGVTTVPVRYRTKSGAVAYGYEADLLPVVCRIYIEAGRRGMLTTQQLRLAERCARLLEGLEAVAMVALVDEATGYQQFREKEELRKILEAYIAPEFLPWSKFFPDEYYELVYKIYGWAYRPGTHARPGVVGTFTNKVIYEELPKGVLPALQERNPSMNGRRKRRHHQLLTEDVGLAHLEKQIVAVMTLMHVSEDMEEFEDLFNRRFRKGLQQSRLNFRKLAEAAPGKFPDEDDEDKKK